MSERGDEIPAHIPQRASVRFDANDSFSVESNKIFCELSPATTQFMDDLLSFEPSTRLSLRDACTHAFFSAYQRSGHECSIDPRSLHTEEALKLPRNTRQHGTSPIEDKAWARRQCSMVWSPMPKTYNFHNTDDKSTGGFDVGSTGRLFATLEKLAIKETSEERLSTWLP